MSYSAFEAAVIAPLPISPLASAQRQQPKKSPPLAFERTPNDSLYPLISPSQEPPRNPLLSPGSNRMASQGTAGGGQDLQHIIEKQANALNLLHTAFSAERQAWSCERDSLYQRIASLERLLRANNTHSPAKSPVTSPFTSNVNGLITSPQARPTAATQRLPSIAEDENLIPLSQRRQNAPRSISMPSKPSVAIKEPQRGSSTGFDEQVSSVLSELAVSPPNTAKALSPMPPGNIALAGHTPLKGSTRSPTPPPKDMLLDGIEDTPTRNNTHINALLTRSHDSDEDIALTGPLNMPELPGQPGEHNFTEEMLFKRLEKIAQSPEEYRPTIFAERSPGLALPEDEEEISQGPSPMQMESEIPLAPKTTRDPAAVASEEGSTAVGSNTISPNGAPMSPQEEAVHQKFEQGGIRLKKKPSSNFGAPFGQLGFGGIRKNS